VKGGVKDFRDFDRKLSRALHSLMNDTLPFRIKALHGWIPSLPGPWVNFIIPIVRFFEGKYLRSRTLLHYEEHAEQLASKLEQDYGIDKRGIPTTMGGEWDLAEGHAAWLSARQAVEREREVAGQ